MIRLKLFLCADAAAIDARLNTLSAFHIAEELNASVFPVVIPRITAVMIFLRDQNDADNVTVQMRISLGDRQLFDGPLPVNFAQRRSARAVADMNGLVLTAPGELRFQIREGDRELGEWIVVVNQVGQPALHPAVVPQAQNQPH